MRTNFRQVSKLAAITIAAVASVVVPLWLLGAAAIVGLSRVMMG